MGHKAHECSDAHCPDHGILGAQMGLCGFTLPELRLIHETITQKSYKGRTRKALEKKLRGLRDKGNLEFRKSQRGPEVWVRYEGGGMSRMPSPKEAQDWAEFEMRPWPRR